MISYVGFTNIEVSSSHLFPLRNHAQKFPALLRCVLASGKLV